MSWMDIPRYKENPIYMFFECYILKTLEKLPSEEEQWIEKLNLHETFKTAATEWQSSIEETLDLSETIKVSIWHLWVKNHKCYNDTQEGFVAFAQDFTDNYMKEDSQVDIWSNDTYLSAVKEIDKFRKANGI